MAPEVPLCFLPCFILPPSLNDLVYGLRSACEVMATASEGGTLRAWQPLLALAGTGVV